jgi:hypothetical protein
MTTRPRLLHIGKRWLALLVGRIGIAGIVAVVALFIFARFSAEFGEQGGGLPRFDQDVLNYLRAHRIQWLFQFAYGVSWLFRPWGQGAFVLLTATAFFLNHRRDATLTLIAGAVGGGLVVASLKALFGRPRPEEIFAPLGYSFGTTGCSLAPRLGLGSEHNRDAFGGVEPYLPRRAFPIRCRRGLRGGVLLGVHLPLCFHDFSQQGDGGKRNWTGDGYFSPIEAAT